jgi:hypothetical protein
MLVRLRLAVIATFFLSSFAFALADDTEVDQKAPAPVPYATFVDGAQAQRGLFTVWHKGGKIYLELSAAQLDHDFVQTIVPGNGLGGHFTVWGNTDHLPAELVRFERSGNNVAILWPNPAFVAPNSPAAQLAISYNFPKSIVGLAPIAAADEKTGRVVIDAKPFLDDQLNLKAVLEQGLGGSKAAAYSLDTNRTYFGKVKAFPENVFIEAKQAWASEAQHVDDVPADPRYIQMSVVYNIAEPPGHPDYRPRYADDRVGIYDDIYLSFDNDEVTSRKLRYIVRWDLQPSDPSKPVSPATHPMVFVMSNSIPEKYRPAIKAAVLKWNAAFLKFGISDALQVIDQPNDPDFDADDIRYNVLRWVTEAHASFGADSQTLYDPRTGEEFRTGVLISADVPIGAKREWTYVVDPARYGRSTDPMPAQFLFDHWLATIMHETGHNLGMQHNFIGSRAYTAKQLQDPAFTAKYGIASTVMEYAPTNVWPKPYGQGDYYQTDIGPYDYYAMHWAYAPIPGATTPEAEIPTLSAWASAWSDPRYRYASDEDVAWADGHAADPRVEQGILTNDPLGWCRVQFGLDRSLIANLSAMQPQAGAAYEDETDAFHSLLHGYQTCAMMPTHFIGGQYISRAHRGDPNAQPPIVPVPKRTQYDAFSVLDKYLFSSDAWSMMTPTLLQRLGYSEWAGYGYVGYEGYGNLPLWAYDPPERHDVPFTETVANLQSAAIKQMLSPAVLARIADGPYESTEAQPMRLVDLFAWMHAAAFRELAGAGPKGGTIDPLRRNLQARYTETLVALYQTPAAGQPDDVRALARADLDRLNAEAAHALRAAHLDPATRAHIAWLQSRTRSALRDDR